MPNSLDNSLSRAFEERILPRYSGHEQEPADITDISMNVEINSLLKAFQSVITAYLQRLNGIPSPSGETTQIIASN